jgi:Uma2 family endonuclease
MVLDDSKKIKITYQDYLNTPDDMRYELREGQLIMMTPAPTTNHQKISRKILIILGKFVEENNLGEVFDAPCDVVFDEENVLQPDILFIAKENSHIITEKNIQGAPDLVIEIISENTARIDMVQKKHLYARFGVKEYWIVIPDERSIEVYVISNKCYTLHQKYNLQDSLTSSLLTHLTFNLKQVF